MVATGKVINTLPIRFLPHINQAVSESRLSRWQQGWWSQRTVTLSSEPIRVGVPVTSIELTLQVSTAADQDFLDAALRYPNDVFVASETLRFSPPMLARYPPILRDAPQQTLTKNRRVADWITRRGEATKILVGRLTPVVQDRLGDRKLRRHTPVPRGGGNEGNEADEYPYVQVPYETRDFSRRSVHPTQKISALTA